MNIGIALEGIRPAAELAAFAWRIETLGFDSLWAPDHVSYSQPICDPFQVLAACASATKRLVLGTGVYLLPLRHPTHVAKMAASLDWMSGGRFVLGVGVGGEFASDFAASEVNVRERGARANEAIGVLRALWTGAEPPAGRFFHVPRTPIAPAPARAGGPPIWVGGRAESALRRAAWLGDGYLGYFLDAAGMASRMAKIRELRAAAPDAARRDAPIAAALLCFARIEDRSAGAVERVAGRIGALYGPETARVAPRFALAGTLEDARRRVAEIEAAGVEHLLLSPVAAGGDLDEQVERLADLV